LNALDIFFEEIFFLPPSIANNFVQIL